MPRQKHPWGKISRLDALMVPAERRLIQDRTKAGKAATGKDFRRPASRFALRMELAEDRKKAEKQKKAQNNSSYIKNHPAGPGLVLQKEFIKNTPKKAKGKLAKALREKM
jgi:hypothetical protein